MIFSLKGAFLAEPDPLLFLIEELISGDDGDDPGVELRSPKNSVTLIASKFRSGNRKHLKTANENKFRDVRGSNLVTVKSNARLFWAKLQSEDSALKGHYRIIEIKEMRCVWNILLYSSVSLLA